MRVPHWLRRSWLHIRAGHCSGFPDCCIAFYSTLWQFLYRIDRFQRWYHEKNDGRGYVACPLCIISGARIRVLRCTDRCGHVAESQALTREKYPGARFG